VSSHFDIWHTRKGACVHCSLCASFTTMVYIRSMVTSSGPCRRRKELEGDATSRSRTGRSHRTSDRTTTTSMAATTVTVRRQHSVATAAMMPPAACPEGVLAAALALLHNPSCSDASPEATEQWCNDVDHLIVIVINMLPHRRHRDHHSGGSPALSCTPTVTCMLIAASLTTTDLRAELEHRRLGEDDCTTIER
jgi:hypothetical protein